jgi:hypothetical protein
MPTIYHENRRLAPPILWFNGFALVSIYRRQSLGEKEESDMKYLALASLVLFLFAATFTVLVTTLTDASGVVCARGVYRAGCAGPHGAVTAHRTVAGTNLEASWQKSNPSVPTGASPVEETEKPVVSTAKSEQRLKTLARQSDKPKGRYYTTALSQAYDFSAR